jgi:NADP-dependent 3-hydroxy acid dehydrogenase YdfG
MPSGLSDVGVLVHCATTGRGGSVATTPADQWHEVFDKNIFALASVTRRLLPLLRREPGDVIIVNSSVAAGSVAARASASGLRTFAEALRHEEAANGIRVTDIDPTMRESEYSWPDFVSAEVTKMLALPTERAWHENLSVFPQLE